MHLLNEILLGVLLVIAPVNGIAQLALARKSPDISRVSVYVSSGILIFVLGAATAIVGGIGAGPASMGLGPIAPLELLAWTLGIAAVVLGVLVLLRWIACELGLPDSPFLAKLFPKTRRERTFFVGLSFVAGTGEEIAYRGYAMSTLGAMSVGPWMAATVTSAAFGLLHCYQGVRGVVGTAVAGFVFAASFILTGSIWPAIAAHIVVDLVAGLVLGEKLLTCKDGGMDACV